MVVGIGASAGGLEAFSLLLHHLPMDTGMAFVLVQHLDPARESALSDILSRATALPVREVSGEEPIEPDHVYVIPPNANLTIARDVLKLGPRPRAAPHRSIDAFFESLAQDRRERAIGVILSGAATDGTLGLEAIKAEGGITFAQDDSAKYDSMPRSAIAAGCVDFVLAPDAIAGELARIARHPLVAGSFADHLDSDTAGRAGEDERASAAAHQDEATALPSGGSGQPPIGAERAHRESEARATKADNDFRKILLVLRNHCGVDFSLYKSNTIQRRIARRMVLSKQESLEDYARFLRGNGKELDALYSDVLISVTSFFRNPEAFEALQRKVFPKLLQQRGEGPFRVWTLGCSTGQEAYSLAMAFVESAEKAHGSRKLQVFATDLNDALLEKARQGLYAKSLAQDIAPQRLRKFFVEEEGGYRVVKSLREMVVFARQNLISDPPFSRMDLVSCRNLLIYLEPSLQQKLLPTFHYALKPEGYLFLGASESVGGFTDLFEPLDKRNKIYAKKAASTPAFNLPVRTERGELRAIAQAQTPSPRPHGAEPAGFRGELNSQREADRVTINRYSPPGVLVNAELQILQFRGATGAWLQPPNGKASFDVLKMARPGLMLPLRATINKAKKEGKAARRESVRVDADGGARTVDVEVVPLTNLRERCYLILFEDGQGGESAPALETAKRSTKAARASSRKEDPRRVAALERELTEMRDYLQSVLEQHDAANEELQASNEEVQSANEELQSINEELETSKEELESANEELTTVNEEMANRNVELNQVNSDLNNLQTSTRLAIVLIGRDLTVRRFSAQAEKQFNLLATDVGRPFGRVRHNLAIADLDGVVEEVITTVREREEEVRDKDGHWFSLRIRPYLTLDNKVDGAVLVLVGIDAQKRVEEAIAEGRDYAEAIIRTAPDPLLVLTAELKVLSGNDAFWRVFRLTPGQAIGRSIFELDQGSWNISKLRALLDDIIPRNSFFDDFEITHDFAKVGRRTVLLNARTLLQGEGKARLVFLGIRDITEVLAFQADLRRSELRYRRLFEAARDGVLILDADSRKITDANPFMTTLLGYRRDELLGKELWQIGLLENEQAAKAAFRELQQKGQIRYEDLPLQSSSGETRAVEVIANRYAEDGLQVVQCNIRDISEQKAAQDALARVHDDLTARAEELSRFNRVAVGRESRMIELKKEINALCERLGEPRRYPLEFEPPEVGGG